MIILGWHRFKCYLWYTLTVHLKPELTQWVNDDHGLAEQAPNANIVLIDMYVPGYPPTYEFMRKRGARL
jgi:hypothetical protein